MSLKRLILIAWVALSLSATVDLCAQPVSPSPEVKVIDLIQLQPSETDLFQEALSFAERNDHSRALNLFLDLLRYYPKGRFAEESLYRIASGYRALGRFPEAQESLALLEKNYPKGAWKEAGFLLAGEILGAEKKWKEAFPYFIKATASKQPELAERAHFLAIIAADHLKDLTQAQASITFLLKLGASGKHWAYANLKEATLKTQKGKTSEALALLKHALETSKEEGIKAEAAVRAGDIYYEKKEMRESIGYYEIVRKTAAPEFWKKLAHVGLIRAYFALPDYKATIEVFNAVRPNFPEQVRPQLFFLAAESYRLSDQASLALPLYDFILKEFPQDALAEPALWLRLLIMQKTGGQDFLSETARYLSLFPDAPRSTTVQILRAGATYEAGDFKNAAIMFESVIQDSVRFITLNPEQQFSLLFRRAHAALMLKDYPSARTYFGRVAESIPNSKLAPQALWFKGQAELSASLPEDAFKSWSQLILAFPKFAQRDQVLWQTAQLAGSLKNFTKMQSLLQLFNQEFPQDKKRGEAFALLALAAQEQGQDSEAVINWQKAREIDSGRYFSEATPQLIRYALKREDLITLQKEVESYDLWKAKRPAAAAVALEVYEWLGQELMLTSDSSPAEPYLRRVIVSTKDKAQRKRVQLRLALLMSQQKKFGAAVREWQIYRTEFPEEANRSPVLEPLALAHIGAAQFNEAQFLAEQILKQNPEGEYNAKGRLLLGEIAFGKRNYSDAAKLFSAVAVLIQDEELTPRALSRAAESYRLAGDSKSAEAMLERLKKEFPKWKNP